MTRLPDCDLYRAMYFTRPSSLHILHRVSVAVLFPLLLLLACVRLTVFCLISVAYLLLPPGLWRRLWGQPWVWRAILFLVFGVVVQATHSRVSDAARPRLLVMNHHGVVDVLLFPLLHAMGVERLLVSYPLDFYARMRRWIFFFDYAFDLVNVRDGRSLVSRSDATLTMAFPEGAGKKARVVVSFHPAIFKRFDEVLPCAVAFNFAIPLVHAYGVDLPFHRTISFLLVLLTPWTVVRVDRLPTMSIERGDHRGISRVCRDAIARVAGYPTCDFLFDQAVFDACLWARQSAAQRGARRRI